jgi:rhamnogalacturonyl hydrolase YesR
VINDPATYLESTLATMAAYAVREGIARGVLDGSRHAAMEHKARTAMHTQIARDGSLQLVSDATPVGARPVYATRPFGTFPWGQGPLLLALCQEVE